MKKIIYLVLFAVIYSSCSNERIKDSSDGGKLKGTITISGAFALYPLTTIFAQEFMRINPGVRINISAGGAGKGIADVLSGIVDIGMVSRELNVEEKNRGAYGICVAKDAVLLTINSNNPYKDILVKRGLKRDDLIGIFVKGDLNYWEDILSDKKLKSKKKKVNVYTRSDACGAGEIWGKYMGYHQEDLHGTGVYGDPGMADAIRKDLYGIGYNNLSYVYDINSKRKYEGIDVLPIDLNENGFIDKEEMFYDNMLSVMKAIREGRYPSPPARNLYFVTKYKPVNNRLVYEFIKWVLTSGQDYVESTGYVKIDKEVLEEEMKDMK